MKTAGQGTYTSVIRGRFAVESEHNKTAPVGAGNTTGSLTTTTTDTESITMADHKPTLTQRDLARFWVKVNKTPTCWTWTGALDRGYGRFWLHGTTDIAHRASWLIHHGPVPDGKQIDHLCRNRACVNPAHLEPVTLAENVLRGNGISAVNARKTHCKQGHPLSGDNLWTRRTGARVCVTCQRQRVRDWRERSAA